MKSLLEQNGFNEIKERLDKLSENSERQWGKMTPAQMACHCQGPLNIILRKEDYGLKPNWFAKTFFKKTMYSDKAWRKNLPTLKIFKQTEDKKLYQIPSDKVDRCVAKVIRYENTAVSAFCSQCKYHARYKIQIPRNK